MSTMQELFVNTGATGLLAAAPAMVEKLRFIVPEIVLFVTTCIVMVVGLSPAAGVRRLCGAVSIIGLLIAGLVSLAAPVPPATLLPNLMGYAKPLIAAVGVLLVLLMGGTVDRDYDESVSRGGVWDGLRATRAEFYSFILFSLTGLMLCTSADDLIWIFLALELTSLPTYVMVSISTTGTRSQEAGIKYFFLGALGAAFFLYGFALLYGATGTTLLFGDGVTPGIAQVIAAQREAGGVGTMALLGMVIAMVGVSFKIAAVPMHFYTADVYEGASSAVSAFLAFVPKAAGFIVLMMLAASLGWAEGGSLPEPVRLTLWVVAAMTMTVGNVLALLQKNVKRVLAYSSIAHSGYMLVGLICGPGPEGGPISGNGLAATLFYLLCYGFMNLGTFAVLASLERRAARGRIEEVETFDDLRGLCATHPLLGWSMALCALSLLGLPPLLGFFGKLFLFTSAIASGEIILVIIMGLNSAIAAFYYLKIAGAVFLDKAPEGGTGLNPCPVYARGVAAVLSAASVVALVPISGWLVKESGRAADSRTPAPVVAGNTAEATEPVSR